MSAVPVPAGAVAVIWVGPSTLKLVAGVSPKSTWVAPASSVPAIVTEVPPVAGPRAGSMPVTVGDGTGVPTVAVPNATAFGPAGLAIRTVVLNVPARR